MKVIDLLNKIANREEVPKKIIWNEDLFEYDDSAYAIESINGTTKTLLEYVLECDLNDEVEIIEENKEIEELNPYIKEDDLIFEIAMNRKAINEVIKAVNELKKGK